MAGDSAHTGRNFVYVLLATFGFLAFLIFRPFISYVLMGGLLVYLLHPLYRNAARVIRAPRTVALWLTLLVLALLVAPLGWAMYRLARIATRLGQGVTPQSLIAFMDTLVQRVNELLGREPEDADGVSEAIISEAFPRVAAYAQEVAPDLATFLASFVVGVFVMLFVLYYGLVEGEKFVAWIMGASPLTPEQNVELLSEIERTLDAVVFGQVIVSLAQGLLITVGFLIFGVPNAILWGILSFVLALLPLIGPPLVWGPAAIWLAFTGHTYAGIGLAVWGAVVVGFSDNLLRPYIVGSRARIHPVLVLVGVLGGIMVFGFVGFVLGPVVLAIVVAVLNFWREDYLPVYERDAA